MNTGSGASRTGSGVDGANLPDRWVILLNYNTADLCRARAGQLRGQDDIGLCIVDNHGNVSDLQALEALMAENGGLCVDADDPQNTARIIDAVARGCRLVLLRSPANVGFGAGNNIALRLLLKIVGERLRVIVMNPDVEASTPAMRALFDDDAGVCGPAVYEHYSGSLRTREESMDFSTGFTDTTRWRNARATGSWLSGCCLKFSGAALQRLGLFPEETFLYDEETFFFARLRHAGYSPRYRDDVSVKHIGSVSTGKRSFHYYYYIFRNRWLFYQRVGKVLFGPRARFYVLYLDWLVGAIRSALRQRNAAGARGILVGALHGLLGIDGRHD